jgi:hypothetical protein
LRKRYKEAWGAAFGQELAKKLVKFGEVLLGTEGLHRIDEDSQQVRFSMLKPMILINPSKKFGASIVKHVHKPKGVQVAFGQEQRPHLDFVVGCTGLGVLINLNLTEFAGTLHLSPSERVPIPKCKKGEDYLFVDGKTGDFAAGPIEGSKFSPPAFAQAAQSGTPSDTLHGNPDVDCGVCFHGHNPHKGPARKERISVHFFFGFNAHPTHASGDAANRSAHSGESGACGETHAGAVFGNTYAEEFKPKRGFRGFKR